MKDTRITNCVVVLILLALLFNQGMVGSGYGSILKPASIPTSAYWLPKQPLLCSSTGADQAKAFSALEKGPLSFIERSEEHTSELQSRLHLVCRLLLEKKKNDN